MRRTPKQLDEAPLQFRKGAAQTVVTGDNNDRDGRLGAKDLPGMQETVVTAERGTVRDLGEVLQDAAPDADVRRAARAVAARLAVRQTRRPTALTRGPGRAETLPYNGDGDEIDLDRTLEVLTERPVPDERDILVRTRIRTRRSVALIVDVSGSMKGEKAKSVAAAVGALAAELVREELTVVAFWKDSALLASPRLGAVNPGEVLDDLLRLPAKGLTNVHVGIEVAAAELARSSCRERFAILLSDCVHNAGPDPRDALSLIPRLHVLLQNDGEHDAWLGRELARLGGGRMAFVKGHRDVAPALNMVFAP